MEDFAELERRFSRAFERIHFGLGALAEKTSLRAGEAEAAEISALRAELEAEKGVSAELENRINKLDQDLDGKVSELEAKLDERSRHLTALDTELQRLRQRRYARVSCSGISNCVRISRMI